MCVYVYYYICVFVCVHGYLCASCHVAFFIPQRCFFMSATILECMRMCTYLCIYLYRFLLFILPS